MRVIPACAPMPVRLSLGRVTSLRLRCLKWGMLVKLMLPRSLPLILPVTLRLTMFSGLSPRARMESCKCPSVEFTTMYAFVLASWLVGSFSQGVILSPRSVSLKLPVGILRSTLMVKLLMRPGWKVKSSWRAKR